MQGSTITTVGSPKRNYRRPSAWTAAAIALLLTAQMAMLASMAYRDSITWDEPAHLCAGMSYWHDGTFHLYRVNPPLVRLIAAAPVMFLHAKNHPSLYSGTATPGTRLEFMAAQEFVDTNGRRSFWLLTAARWACLPVSLLGGVFCFIWAKSLYGTISGFTALLLWTFGPNILAYGHLITPDMGATALGLAAAFFFLEVAQIPVSSVCNVGWIFPWAGGVDQNNLAHFVRSLAGAVGDFPDFSASLTKVSRCSGIASGRGHSGFVDLCFESRVLF